jgi:glucosamine-6-phosphate deaminase
VELTVMTDAMAVAEAVAERLLQERRASSQRPLGLATGRTMLPVYRALWRQFSRLSAPEQGAIRQGWLSFNLDEYVGLGPTDPRSFAAFMADQLQVLLGLAPAQVQLPNGLAVDPRQEAGRYRAALTAAGGIGLQLLGLGGNGHVGFNEPPCGPEAPCRSLALSAATRTQNAAAFGGEAGAVPLQAITLGLAEILAAERILLVVTGAAKATILRRALLDPPGRDVPASWLQHHPRLEVLVDGAAAAALPRVR